MFMQFDTKIAVVIRTDLEAWQKLNVASFLAGGIAAAFPECVGAPYEDGSATQYLSLIGQPILIYGADRAALARALERALARNVRPALYTEDMFKTTHDEANRAAVKAVARSELNLVGLAVRAQRTVGDKIMDGRKFHGWPAVAAVISISRRRNGDIRTLISVIAARSLRGQSIASGRARVPIPVLVASGTSPSRPMAESLLTMTDQSVI